MPDFNYPMAIILRLLTFFSSERRFIAHFSPKNSPPLRAATQFDQPNGD
ncbi:hypothetical protein ACE1B4_08810 [Aeromonas veronii]|nr:hypothetical protein [Aeromonas veronii]HDO1313011.1 hypothetical protein [Aeromonas veronii]